MMGKSHLVISTGITLSVLGLANQQITLPVIGVTLISSLLPDIDEPNSLLVRKAFPDWMLRYAKLFLLAVGIFIQFQSTTFAPWNTILAILVGFVLFLPSRNIRNLFMVLIGMALFQLGEHYAPWSYLIGSLLIICTLVPHRGLTHTLYGVLTWTALLFYATHSFDRSIWIAGGLSYLLHLLADALTNRGIRPLPPFNFRLKVRLMTTGTWTGSIVESIFIGATLILVWLVFFQDLNASHYFTF
ncbi:metal-dependent hydrolase [Paenibacillus chitinolyticus]|uniref:metal-dependent hydrolase n=1 Tax=Paenibacillus chitinolyticus TaxID=79263 RepID=UPI00295E9B56|nr:metal-dependent hydrolase [Paenibacillus chitinolyticus]